MSIHLDIDLGPVEQVDLVPEPATLDVDVERPTVEVSAPSALDVHLDIDLEPLGQVDIGVDLPGVDISVDLPSIDIGVPGGPGPIGPEGPPGDQGETGPPGTLILFGVETPSSSTGMEGDFYLDTDDHVLYGPKTGSVWPIAIAQGGAAAVDAAVFDFPVPQPVWVGVHGFNQSPVDVTLVDDLGQQFLGNVTFPTTNTVQATFGLPVAGHMLVQK